jgi:glycosyltransferase A (GT-A) superfamily protein (DUF2064 family)
MRSVSVAIVCKTPITGICKTRLSPPLRPEECAAISACFIRDISTTIDALARTDRDVRCYAVYTPIGSEARLRAQLSARFRLLPPSHGDLGDQLLSATVDLPNAGHDGAILVNSDSPTLPLSILQGAVRAVRQGDAAVLSPALDGGYALIGLTNPHARLFAGIPWRARRRCIASHLNARVRSICRWSPCRNGTTSTTNTPYGCCRRSWQASASPSQRRASEAPKHLPRASFSRCARLMGA